MKRLLFAVASAAAFAIAAPALAQDYPPPGPAADAAPGHDIRGQIDALRARVKAGFDQGQLSQGETDRLYREIDRIGAVAQSDRDANGHLSDHDRTDLQGRIDNLSRSIHWRRAEAVSPPSPPEAAPPPPPEAAPPAPTPTVWSLEQRENWLQTRIDRGVDEGRLSGSEVTRGQNELHAIRAEQGHLSERDGGALSPEDRSYLIHRIDELNQTLRWSGRNPPPPWAGV